MEMGEFLWSTLTWIQSNISFLAWFTKVLNLPGSNISFLAWFTKVLNLPGSNVLSKELHSILQMCTASRVSISALPTKRSTLNLVIICFAHSQSKWYHLLCCTQSWSATFPFGRHFQKRMTPMTALKVILEEGFTKLNSISVVFTGEAHSRGSREETVEPTRRRRGAEL